MEKLKSLCRSIKPLLANDPRESWRYTSCTAFCICRAATTARRRNGDGCGRRSGACSRDSPRLECAADERTLVVAAQILFCRAGGGGAAGRVGGDLAGDFQLGDRLPI